jgi:hypothetical protein
MKFDTAKMGATKTGRVLEVDSPEPESVRAGYPPASVIPLK